MRINTTLVSSLMILLRPGSSQSKASLPSTWCMIFCWWLILIRLSILPSAFHGILFDGAELVRAVGDSLWLSKPPFRGLPRIQSLTLGAFLLLSESLWVLRDPRPLTEGFFVNWFTIFCGSSPGLIFCLAGGVREVPGTGSSPLSAE